MISLGIDNLPLDKKFKSFALLCNASTVNSSYTHLIDLIGSEKIKCIFGPEHGFGGAYQDMETTSESAPKVISLYGKNEASLIPDKDDLQEVDALIVDLPDVGARYYTYANSMYFCQQVCSELNIPVIVLDRPNPINGNVIEGSTLKEDFRSFCGLAPIPQRHSLTLGELAKLFNTGLSHPDNTIEGVKGDLKVVEISGWKREMHLDECDLPWLLPSPNLPTLDGALLYPGACLLEGTEISEGRGTTKPFELFGTPYLDTKQLIGELGEQPGVKFRELQFKPGFQKFAGKLCNGVQIHITQRQELRSFKLFKDIISLISELHPKEFRWREKPYEFKENVPAIDLLYGDETFRLSNTSEDREEKFLAWFSNHRNQFLLYD